MAEKETQLKQQIKTLEEELSRYRQGLNEASMPVIGQDITRLKEAEIALKQSEDSYRDLVENSHDLICTHDLAGTIISVNKAVEKLMGLDKEKIIGRNLREGLDPGVLVEYASYLSIIGKEGTARGLMTVITARGEKRILEYNNTLRTEGVAAPVVRGMARDVTDRIRAERKLRNTLSLLRTTLESAASGILAVDNKGNILTYNNRFTDMWQIPEDVIHSRDIERVLAIAGNQLIDAEEFVKKRQTMMEQPDREFFDELLLKDGRIFERTSRPQRETGKTIGRVYFFRDITAPKKMEESLRESEERYRTIIENIEEGYYEVDLAGNYTFLNDAGLKILGYCRAEVIGADNRKFTDEENYDKIHEVFKKIYSARGTSLTCEWEGLRKDGSRRHVESSVSLIRNIKGKSLGFRGIIRDVTEKRKTEETIRRMAYHDFLTGLPNRLLLSDRLNVALTQVKRQGGKVALMTIDLDRFKEINDTLGHHMGDILLQEVGKRLANMIRESDTAARMGGDEFMLLLHNVADEKDANVIAAKVVEAFQKPFNCEEYSLHITPSIGIALCPDHGLDILTLMKHADQAMYQAKEKCNNYCMYGRQ